MTGQQTRIMIVDDLSSARQLLGAAIKDVLAEQNIVNYVLCDAASFKEAMVMLDQKFDFAFVDLHLPDGRGWDIIRSLKANPEIIIAAVTVMDDRESVEATLAAGVDGYLIKRAKEVAEQLMISSHTVRDHLKSIYRKLDVSSRAEVAIEAQKRNLT